jgi:hypothetical protein
MCASLLVMKPLLARLFPKIVGEQPYSAREERRSLRAATGLQLLNDGTADVEKAEDRGRRDTAVAMDGNITRVTTPARALDARRHCRSHSW